MSCRQNRSAFPPPRSTVATATATLAALRAPTTPIPALEDALTYLLGTRVWPEAETQSRKDLDGPILTRAALEWFDKCLGASRHPQGRP